MSRRAELRRQEKAKTHTVTYHYTAEQLTQLRKDLISTAMKAVEKEREEEREAIMSQSIVYVLGITLKVLREMGWGKMRLSRFTENVLHEYNEGDEPLDVMRDRIYKETGCKFMYEGETP